MQARENTSESLTIFELLQEMYPGKCGYKVRMKLDNVWDIDRASIKVSIIITSWWTILWEVFIDVSFLNCQS